LSILLRNETTPRGHLAPVHDKRIEAPCPTKTFEQSRRSNALYLRDEFADTSEWDLPATPFANGRASLRFAAYIGFAQSSFAFGNRSSGSSLPNRLDEALCGTIC
jgi:hypothetical protein